MPIRRCLLLVLIALATASHAVAADVSFHNDVMAVLSKAGCNAGVCHGNASGKGGFKLSLRGQDPAEDFRTLTRAMANRRTNAVEPERSLILLKPTMHVAHEGGKRFDEKSPEYRILRDWIAAGTPADAANAPRLTSLAVSPRQKYLVDPEKTFSLRVTAKFSDRSIRDVTRLAVYEPAAQNTDVSADGKVTRLAFGENTITVRYLDRQVPVRVAFIPTRPGFVWQAPPPANFVDRHVYRKLQSLRMNPSPVAGDSVFLRRAYLDLLGILPTADDARAFVADKHPDKRAKLVDRLLKRPEFADYWALKWSDLLRNEEKTLDRKGVQAFYKWIRNAIATGKPLNQFARELIASRGSTYKQPASNFYRAMRDPFTRGESTAQLFLGIRLQCARCHNHPFDRWTQDDYYGWANNFARVKYKVLKNKRRDKNDKHEFDGEQVVYMAKNGEVTNPRIDRPTPPRFLGDATSHPSAGKDRLQQLADWVADPHNERFAKTQANRIWFHLLGRGIVDPIDDFRATNPPANPELLDALAKDFAAQKFDLRHVIRTIVTSKTYQLSSRPNETNRDDDANFSHAVVRRLTAEQTLDALAQVTGVPVEFNGYPPGTRAGQIAGVRAVRRRDRRPSEGDQFLKLFGKPPRLQACECERSAEATLNQTFQLVSGPLLNDLLSDPKNRLTGLLKRDRSDALRVTELYWTALTRPPSPGELKKTVELLRAAPDRRKALEDVLWALLNSNEFQLRR
jgi:Protein of unknown function (DUF1549)/Protein of unknown function (DUF1553)